MADQRILLKCGEDEIVLAKRVGVEWRSAVDASNDLGTFLTKCSLLADRCTIEMYYEHGGKDNIWYCDPIFKLLGEVGSPKDETIK